MQKEQGRWKLLFENGNTAFADLLIGADGANSKIRPFVTNLKPVWTGIMTLEGSLKDAENSAPHIHQLLKGGKIFAYGDEKTLIVNSKENGSFGFLIGWKTTASWQQECGIDFKDNTQVLAWFKSAFPDWSPVWHELFDRQDTIFIPRPQYCMPLDQRWTSQSDITLIGDAAHWMPPFAGEGVNMAMLDALQLSLALTEPLLKDAASAIDLYERQMLTRFSKIGQETLFNTEWMHQPHALKGMLDMFGGNKLRQGLFFSKMAMKVHILPAFRSILGLAPHQEAFT